MLHAALRIGDGMILMSDGNSTGQPTFQGFALSISLPDIPKVERLFAALADGGQVQMPLTKTFWSPRFGMLVDRFGVTWMVNGTAA